MEKENNYRRTSVEREKRIKEFSESNPNVDWKNAPDRLIEGLLTGEDLLRIRARHNNYCSSNRD